MTLVENNHIIVIGAQKAGTTWLQHVLESDPRICTSKNQEVHFFDRGGNKDIFEYHRIYDHCSKCSATVDVTPDYMDDPTILNYLHTFHNSHGFNPKIVAILREPFQRAFSAYQMRLRLEEETDGFLHVLEGGGDIVEKSMYGKHLSRWIDAGFGPRMKIILFDDLVSRPPETLSALSEFIGLDSPLSSRYIGHRVNIGGLDRIKEWRILRQKIGHVLRRHNMHHLIHYLKRNGLIQLIDSINKKAIAPEPGVTKFGRKVFFDDVHLLDRYFPELQVKKRWNYTN